MALIKCPECGKEISDKAKQCIHCGYPLEDIKINICNINGKKVDLSWMLQDVNSMTNPQKLVKEYGLDSHDAIILYKIVRETKKIPNEYVSEKRNEYNNQVCDMIHQSNIPKCPTCGSTNIEKIGGMERAGSIAMWGIFSKKINKTFKCKKCGYTW